MACKQYADCKHYNAWWCDKRPGCDDFEKKSKSEPVITEPKEEAPKSKRKKADK